MELDAGSADGVPGFDSSAALPATRRVGQPSTMNDTTTADDVAQFHTNLDFDVTKSEHTELDSVPLRADIKFEGDEEPRTSVGGGLALGLGTGNENDAILDEMMEPGIGVRFIIERAMLDPEATVIPRVL